MARLNPAKAVRDLSYIARQRSLGRMTPQLEAIEAHHKAFLAGKNACRRCGRDLEDEKAKRDGYGRDCLAIIQAEQAAAVA